MNAPDEPRVVEASTGQVESGETDVSGSPEPVPDGFPKRRPAHDQARPEIPEGEEGEPADPGPETHPGKPIQDRDSSYTEGSD